MPKILHIVEKEDRFENIAVGVYESFMWDLCEEDLDADYVAFHRSKKVPAHLGGELVEAREASAEEIAERPQLEGAKGRLVLRFRVSPQFRAQARVKWGGVQKHGKAFKSLEEIEEETGEEAA